MCPKSIATLFFFPDTVDVNEIFEKITVFSYRLKGGKIESSQFPPQCGYEPRPDVWPV